MGIIEVFMRKITKLLAAFLCLFALLTILIYANNTSAEQQSTGLLVINVQDGSNYKGIEGAYFQITSQSDASYTKIVKTDNTGRLEINLVPDNYNIKQLGTTINNENYTFTSIGYSRKIEAGKTVTLTGYERKIEGDYIFGDSPTTVHVSTNSNFDSSPLGQGIKASTLNLDGTTSALIPSSQIYSYYNNVDTSIPGEYMCIYMATQSILGVRTTHYLKVIVDPLAPIRGGDVTAKYIDTDGNKISDDVVKTGNIGESYSTEQKLIPGYSFKEFQGSTSGTFTDKTQTVTYVYTKDQILGGDVTVRYVDTDGNKISDDVVKTGNIGESYSIEQESIPGYTFKEAKGNTSGTFTDKTQTITYIYTKGPLLRGDITVRYVDTDDNKISDDVVETGNIGEGYSTEQKLIPGYTFKEAKGNTSGTFTDRTQTITYVYIKNVTKDTTMIIDKSEHLNTQKYSIPNELPETGENQRKVVLLVLLGFAILIFSAVLIFSKHKKIK